MKQNPLPLGMGEFVKHLVPPKSGILIKIIIKIIPKIRISRIITITVNYPHLTSLEFEVEASIK